MELKIKRIGDATVENFADLFEKYLDLVENIDNAFKNLATFKKLIAFLVECVEEPVDRAEAEKEIRKLSLNRMIEIFKQISGEVQEPQVPLETSNK